MLTEVELAADRGEVEPVVVRRRPDLHQETGVVSGRPGPDSARKTVEPLGGLVDRDGFPLHGVTPEHAKALDAREAFEGWRFHDQ